MPFDAIVEASSVSFDEIALYQKRREDAAALWRSIPPSDFYLGDWDCGTTACAIGWLARLKYDGWSKVFDRCPSFNGKFRMIAASDYFGITLIEATTCFGCAERTLQFYGRVLVDSSMVPFDNAFRSITLAEVGDKLLTLPYTI